MYNVHFADVAFGENDEVFSTYDAAMEYWNDFADTETCQAGIMTDTDTGEIIWEFDDRNKG